jgi:Transmembrane amino acid transporter protein
MLSPNSLSQRLPCSLTQRLPSSVLVFQSGRRLSVSVTEDPQLSFPSYLIIVKSLMPNVVASLYHDFTGPDTNPPEWAMNGRNWITIFMVVLIPLAYMKHLNSLRYTSYVALFTVGKLLLTVLVS